MGEQIMITTSDSASINRAKQKYYIALGDYKQALKWEHRQNTTQNHTTQVVWDQSVVKMQRDYLDQKNKVIVAEKKLQQIYTIIVSGVIISIIAGLLLYVQNKRKKDKAKYAKLQKMLEWQNLNSREQLEKNKQAILYLEKQLMQTANKNSNLIIELKQKTIELTEAPHCFWPWSWC